MTLLRRAPREVYRVYDEDEFFASAGIGQCGEAPAPELEGRAHRVAGVTVLLAAVGAVTGLVVITSLSPAARAGRRAGARLSADGDAVGSSRPASTRIWSGAADAGGSSIGDAATHVAPGRGGDSATLARRVEMVRRAAAARPATGSSKAAVARRLDAAVVHAPSVPSTAESSSAAVSMTASATTAAGGSPGAGTSGAVASSGAARSGQPEFGFER